MAHKKKEQAMGQAERGGGEEEAVKEIDGPPIVRDGSGRIVECGTAFSDLHREDRPRPVEILDEDGYRVLMSDGTVYERPTKELHPGWMFFFGWIEEKADEIRRREAAKAEGEAASDGN